MRTLVYNLFDSLSSQGEDMTDEGMIKWFKINQDKHDEMVVLTANFGLVKIFERYSCMDFIDEFMQWQKQR